MFHHSVIASFLLTVQPDPRDDCTQLLSQPWHAAVASLHASPSVLPLTRLIASAGSSSKHEMEPPTPLIFVPAHLQSVIEQKDYR